VTVETGDSTLPPSAVAGGSNQTASCCSVVMKACDHIRRKLYGTTSETVGGSGSGEATGSGNLEDAFNRLKLGAIEEYAEFLPPGAKPDAIKQLYAGKPSRGGGSHGQKLM